MYNIDEWIPIVMVKLITHWCFNQRKFVLKLKKLVCKLKEYN